MSYLEHFGLSSEPFSNAPVSRFYYSAPQHQQALQRLLYAVNSMKGLAVLVGQIGAGKSTLARRLLDSMPEEEYEAALLVIIHSGITASWLLRRIALQLGVENPAQEKLALLSQLYQRLLQIYEQGRKAVVLIDEAQMLETRELMEEFRGLLNLEVPERKLISFVFFGLPEIEKNLKLDPPLAQRVAMRYRLEPFSSDSTDAYIKHRLRLAGSTHGLFTPGAVEAVHRRAGGTPRVINTLCDNALFETFLARAREIDAALIEQIADNLGLEYGAPSAPPEAVPVAAAPVAPPEPPPIVAVPRGAGARAPVEFGGASTPLTAALEGAGSAVAAAPHAGSVATAVGPVAPVIASVAPVVGSGAVVGAAVTGSSGPGPGAPGAAPVVGSGAALGAAAASSSGPVPSASSGPAGVPASATLSGGRATHGGSGSAPVAASPAPSTSSPVAPAVASVAAAKPVALAPSGEAPEGGVSRGSSLASTPPAVATAGPGGPGGVPPAFPSPPSVAPATGTPSALASLAAAARNFSAGPTTPAPPPATSSGGSAPPAVRPMVAGVPVNVLIRPGSPRPSAPTETAASAGTPAEPPGTNAAGGAASKPRTGVDLAEIDRYLEGLGKL